MFLLAQLENRQKGCRGGHLLQGLKQHHVGKGEEGGVHLVLWGRSVIVFFGSGKASTPTGRGAVNRAQERDLENHSATCVP